MAALAPGIDVRVAETAPAPCFRLPTDRLRLHLRWPERVDLRMPSRRDHVGRLTRLHCNRFQCRMNDCRPDWPTARVLFVASAARSLGSSRCHPASELQSET